MSLTCAIVITTRNRLRDLQRTFEAIQQLSPQPDEILVCADGCTDGTAEFIRALPRVRLTVNNPARGSISSRDSMIRQAECDLLLSLDDDSHPVESDFIPRAAAFFEANPRLAVETFPQHSDEFPGSLDQKDFGPSKFAGTYTSSGAMIRRSAFLELGGYPAHFFHAYEEPDFALRCVAGGWEVRYETSLHVRHYYSGSQRSEMRVHHFHSRNELWSVVMRCPAPWLIGVGLFRIARQFGYARTRGTSWMLREPRWWMSCLAGLPECARQRKPIPWKYYRRWMELVRHPIPADQEWKEQLSA